LNEKKVSCNPFLVLDVPVDAEKKEILIQVVNAMKKRQYDARTIAESQKVLFNPLKRAVNEFQYAFLSHDANDKQKVKQKAKQKTKQKTKQMNLIEHLSIPDILNFDNEKTTA